MRFSVEDKGEMTTVAEGTRVEVFGPRSGRRARVRILSGDRAGQKAHMPLACVKLDNADRLWKQQRDRTLAAITALAKPCSPAAGCQIWYIVGGGNPAVVAKIRATAPLKVAKPLYAMSVEDYRLHRRYYKEIYRPEYGDLDDDAMRRRIAKKWNMSVERLSDNTWHSVGLVIWQAVKAGRVLDLRTNR